VSGSGSVAARCRAATVARTDGKADWLAADLPHKGDARLVGPLTRRSVPTVADDATVAAARSAEKAVGFGR